MRLKILTPTCIFAEVDGVSSIVVDTNAGSVGPLPRRLDCVAPVVPGILTYLVGEARVDLAVDEGVLIKTGGSVLISVRHAIRGVDLSDLHDAVKREFLRIDALETQVRLAVTKMEGGLLAKVAEWEHAT